MPPKRTKFWEMRKASAAFIICLLAVFPASYIRIYCGWHSPSNHLLVRLDNLAWFFPQEILPHGFYINHPNGAEAVFSAPTSIFLSILFWTFIGFGFAWVTRKLRLRFTIPLAAISILGITFAAHALLYFLFGIEADMDGP